jgi:MFS transporter, YQGE family, putative transporter
LKSKAFTGNPVSVEKTPVVRKSFGLFNYHLKPQAWWLLFISGIFSLSVGLSNTFVNIFVFKVDRSYTSIAFYNLFVYVVMPLAFIAAGWVAKRYHTAITMRVGILAHALFFATVLFVGKSAAHAPYFLGMFMGLAAGFYWFSFNVLCISYTDHGTRDRFFGLNGVVAAIAGMVAPPVSGFLISSEDRFGGLSGYHLVFGLSFGLFVAATLFSFHLKATHTKSPLELGRAFRAMRERKWRSILLGCMVYGLREGVFLFLIGVLLYVATGSELRLGEFLLLQSGLSFVSFFIVGRLAKPSNRLGIMTFGAFGMAGAALLFLLPIRTQTVVIYGCLIAVLIPFFLTPFQGTIFDGITAQEPKEEAQSAYVIAREVFENAGRVIGISAFLCVVSYHPTLKVISSFAVVLGFVQLGTIFFLWWGSRQRGKKETQRLVS